MPLLPLITVYAINIASTSYSALGQTKTQDIIQDEIGTETYTEVLPLQYLDMGMESYSAGKWKETIRNFENAIMTNKLNSMGKVVSHWHIALSWAELNNEDETGEALLSFIMAGQDILDSKLSDSFASLDSFIEEFLLIPRMDWAKSYMNMVWVKRSREFGRKLYNPIIVENKRQLEFVSRMLDEICSNQCSVTINQSKRIRNSYIVSLTYDNDKDTLYIVMIKK